MLEGNDIICFCNDWDGEPLSKKHIVLRLARNNRVLWVNSIGNRNPTVSVRDMRRAGKKLWQYLHGCRRVADNVFLFSPLVVPFHGNPAANWVNSRLLAWSLRRACKKLGFRKPITLTFLPSSADVVGSLGEQLVVYYCVDEYSQFTGTDRTAMLQMERRLIEKSDLVIVSSNRLHETKRRFNPDTFLLTHGVDVAHFRNACVASTVIPEDCTGLPRPVIGFFGLIADWVDLEVIRFMASSRPEWSFLVIGEIQVDTSALRSMPNVHLLGRRSYHSLPSYCKVFDVAIMPFLVNELTLAANPLKVREYLAAGLPVVATPLPEVVKLNSLVTTARTPEEFLDRTEALLKTGKRGPDLSVSRLMDPESWDVKVEEFSWMVTHMTSQRRKHRRRAA